jgi:TFIIF-interacting CTD phosphatase-like protein
MPETSKLNILLDLDETLINSIYPSEFDFESKVEKAKKFTFYDMDKDYIIFERPNLQEFLDYLFKNFKVSIWTAASKSYALFIIDKIILGNNPDRKLEYIFFDYHCGISKKNSDSSKKLDMLWDYFEIKGMNEDNTIIFDDNMDVYNSQPENCLIAKPFEFEDEDSDKDNFLEVIKPVIEKIADNVSKNKKPLRNIKQEHAHKE